MKNETIILTHNNEPENFSSKKKTKNLGHIAAKSSERSRDDGRDTEKADAQTSRSERRERVDALLRRRAPEVQQLHDGEQAEHLGHMLVAAEAADVTARESRSRSVPEKAKFNRGDPKEKIKSDSLQPGTEKRIDTLSRPELLSLSEKIMVDGTSLRQIYETHLIGERGLRRLVAEYMHGGDLKKALRSEVLEREIDFERDPVLRDISPLYQAAADSTSSTVLNELLEKVTIQGKDESEEAAFYKARAHYEVQQLAEHQKKRHTIDISITITILFLITLIVVLYLTRH